MMGRPPRTLRDPIREADIRNEDMREPVRAKVRTRKGSAVDQMNLPAELLAEFGAAGIDLQWNTETVVGMPAQQEMVAMAQQAWEPVMIGMFDGRLDYLMPRGTKGQVRYGAARLDWRPMELSDEARAEELDSARASRYAADRKMAAGTPDGVDSRFMDTNHPKAKAQTFLRKEVGRVPSMTIPD